MKKMLSINETFFLLRNQSFDIEHKQFLCVFDMKIWLIIHFMVTRLIDTGLLLYILLQLCMIMIMFFYRYFPHVSNILEGDWLNIYQLDSYSLMILVLKKEIKLIFIYVYITFLYTWLQLVDSNYTVSYMNFFRWLIEASLILQILCLTLTSYCALCPIDFFRAYHLFYAPTMIMKVPLFILMRYAEIESDLFVNKFQISLFNAHCYSRWK
jgi:hypothetical protein